MNDLFPAPPDQFEEFWAAYPRKVGKGQARKAYLKALKSTSHDDIMFGLSQQRASMAEKEKQFIPHASTWLNGGRWNDEVEQGTHGSHDTSADTTAQRISIAARASRAPSGDLR